MRRKPFRPPPTRLMSPAEAQDVARLYNATADGLTKDGLRREAALSMRDSLWWLTYSIALAHGEGDSTLERK